MYMSEAYNKRNNKRTAKIRYKRRGMDEEGRVSQRSSPQNRRLKFSALIYD